MTSKLRTLLDQYNSSDASMAEVVKLGSRGPYDLVENNKETLLVTIGDSWTFGRRLEDEFPADPEAGRVEHCYGQYLARYFDADFLNYSVPGINNLWMIEKYKTLVQIADQLDYKKIIVFIGLTEYGREIWSEFDGDPELNDLYRQANSPRELAVALTRHISNQILSASNPKVKLVLGLNYVNNIYPPELSKFFIDQVWLECIRKEKFNEECLVIGNWVIEKYKLLAKEFNPDADQNLCIKEVITMIDQAETRLNQIYNSGLNHKEGYGHPNSAGHKVWADYILTKIDDILVNQNS